MTDSIFAKFDIKDAALTGFTGGVLAAAANEIFWFKQGPNLAIKNHWQNVLALRAEPNLRTLQEFEELKIQEGRHLNKTGSRVLLDKIPYLNLNSDLKDDLAVVIDGTRPEQKDAWRKILGEKDSKYFPLPSSLFEDKALAKQTSLRYGLEITDSSFANWKYNLAEKYNNHLSKPIGNFVFSFSPFGKSIATIGTAAGIGAYYWFHGIKPKSIELGMKVK